MRINSHISEMASWSSGLILRSVETNLSSLYGKLSENGTAALGCGSLALEAIIQNWGSTKQVDTQGIQTWMDRPSRSSNQTPLSLTHMPQGFLLVFLYENFEHCVNKQWSRFLQIRLKLHSVQIYILLNARRTIPNWKLQG